MELSDVLKMYLYFNLWVNVKGKHFRNCMLKPDVSLERSIDALKGASSQDVLMWSQFRFSMSLGGAC